MSLLAVQVDAKDAIRAFAQLKQCSVYTVVYNAMKDFVSEAYRVTPIAELKVSPYAKLTPKRLDGKPLRGGKEEQYIRMGKYPQQEAHLKKYRAYMMQRWSVGSWVAAMRMLGMGSSKGSKNWLQTHKRKETVSGENVIKSKIDRKTSPIETITLTDKIGFDKLPGAEQVIIARGEAKAVSNIAKEWERQIRKKWGA